MKEIVLKSTKQNLLKTPAEPPDQKVLRVIKTLPVQIYVITTKSLL